MGINKSSVKEVSPTVAKKKLEKDALLVDVREYYQVKELACDVPNFVVIPFGELRNCFSELPKNKELILICRGGGKSMHAAIFLKEQGFDKVANMQGGLSNWHALGLPMKKDFKEKSSPENSCCLFGNTEGSSCCNLPSHK